MSQEHDADRQPATDYGITHEDQTTSWFLEDEQAAITIDHSGDVWTAAVEDFSERLEDV